MNKECVKCGDVKSTEEFHLDSKRKDGFFPWCCSCRSKYNKTFKLSVKSDPDGAKSRSSRWNAQRTATNELKAEFLAGRHIAAMLHRYNITAPELLKLLKIQENKCAICKRQFGTTKRDRFSVDHDHETDIIRGLLCGGCNAGIGLLGDSADNLLSAVAYLDKPPANIPKRELKIPIRIKNRRNLTGMKDSAWKEIAMLLGGNNA